MLLLVVTIAGFILFDSFGRTLAAPELASRAKFGAGMETQQMDTLLHVLLALLVVIVASRLLGGIFRRLRQPPVIGEILTGISPRDSKRIIPRKFPR
jgi:hypothetical protein